MSPRIILFLSKFSNEHDAEKIAHVEFLRNSETGCFVADHRGVEIPGEAVVRVRVAGRDPEGFFTIYIFQNGKVVMNLSATLRRYANAMFKFPSGYYLDVHLARQTQPEAEEIS